MILMSSNEVRSAVADGVATITLDRPKRLNALTASMCLALRSALVEADRDDSVGAIVLTGAGRGFCSGYDMAELDGIARGEKLPIERFPFDPAQRPDFQTQYSYFPSIGKPIVAAVNGAAVGLGLILALYSDIRLASTQARFTTAFASRGLIAEHGISWILPRIVGFANAMELLLSARELDAQEAFRIGLVHRVIEAQDFERDVFEYARRLVRNVSPRSTRVMKRQLYDAQFTTLARAVSTANVEMQASLSSEDFREGVAHFLEKRPASFIGR